MIKIRKESNEVLYPDEDIVYLDKADLTELKKLALKNPKKNVRLCAHTSPKSKLHEMFIVHTKDYYVRPHKHMNKCESGWIIEGEVDIVLFDNFGKIIKVLSMGDQKSQKKNYYRLYESVFHMLIIKTDFLIFHEVTTGPFNLKDTIFPDWAPKKYNAKFLSQVEENKLYINSKI